MKPDHFRTATEFLTQESRRHVLDSLACVFHNEGYSLAGNTAENDVDWLADWISRELDEAPLDRQTDARANELKAVAKVAMSCLPALAERIAARYIRVSQAIRTIEQIGQQQLRQQKKK